MNALGNIYALTPISSKWCKLSPLVSFLSEILPLWRDIKYMSDLLPALHPASLRQSWFVPKIGFHCKKTTYASDSATEKNNRGNINDCLQFTCVLLRQHRSVDDSLECSNPLSLILLSLAYKEELPARGHYSNSKDPAVALDARRKARKYYIIVLLTANEGLTSCKSILQAEGQMQVMMVIQAWIAEALRNTAMNVTTA